MSKVRIEDNQIEIYHHPDVLFDAPYEPKCLSVDRYVRVANRFNVTKTDPQNVVLKERAGTTLTVTAWAPRVLRIRAAPDDSVLRPSTTESLRLINGSSTASRFTCANDDHRFVLKTEDLVFVLDHASNEIGIANKDGDALLQTTDGGFRFSNDPPEYGGHRFLAMFSLADEQVFGFGGRIVHPNRTGTTVDIFCEKVGKRSGDYGGFPIPFFLSNRGYGFFLNNPWPHVYFDMGKTFRNRWFVQAPGGECDIFIIYGPEFSDILRSYTQITGRIPLPTRSLLGFWCSSQTFVSAAQVTDTIKRLKAEGYPCDIAVLDGPWRGGPDFVEQYRAGKQYPSNDLSWHPDFGDGPAMVKSLEAIRTKTYLHLNSRNFHPQTTQEAIPKNLLRQHGEEVVARLLDERGEEYYEGFVSPRVQDGIFGWWTDHSDRVSGEIRPGLPSRNLFGTLWNRLLAQIMAKHGHHHHLALTRGSGIAGQRYGLPWPGDTRVGIDAFQEDIWFCLNVALAGYPISSVDLAGFSLRKGIDDYANDAEKRAETFDEDNICRRLCQALFFIPTPRIHNNWDTEPRFPWNCFATTQPLYKKMLAQRYRLTPYLFSYALNAWKTGEPILRPLVYHHRTDPTVYSIGDQLYLGEWLLVAPVVKKAQTVRRVYLPEGRWIHMWSDTPYTGPRQVEVDAPLYEIEGLPVFVKAGAILPRQPMTDSLTEAIPGQLTLDVYPQGKSQFELIESDTVTSMLRCRQEAGRITVNVENASDLDRLYEVRFHHVPKFRQLFVDGQVIESTKFQWDVGKKILTYYGPIEKLASVEIVALT